MCFPAMAWIYIKLRYYLCINVCEVGDAAQLHLELPEPGTCLVPGVGAA